MRISFRRIDERTYTIGNTQYWKRLGKCYSWTESGGRVEISEDEYTKAISGGNGGSPKPTSSKEDKAPPLRRKVEKPKSYREASPEDLALLAQDGDKKAEEALISRYEPLVHKIANKYFLAGGDHDDLVQDGLIGIWDAIKYYDERKNNNFTKFIGDAIDARLKVSVRSDNAGKHSVINNATSMDTPVDNGEGEGRSLGDTLGAKGPSIEEKVLGKEGARKLLGFMKNELASKERDVIFRFINGADIRTIAAETGMSYKSVENALMRARNKIREYKASMDESTIVAEEPERKISITFRKKKDLDESEFTYKGVLYKCVFGRYTKDGKLSNKEEYHKARKAMLNDDDTKPGTLAHILSLPGKIQAAKHDTFNNFVDSLEFDRSYEITRDTRGHLEKIPLEDTDTRVSQIMEETGFDENQAFRINSMITDYTSTKPSKILGEDKALFDSYLDTCPVYDGIPLYRGMGFNSSDPEAAKTFETFKNLEIGDTISSNGYISYSSNEDVAMNFADNRGDLQVFIVNTKNLSAVSIDHLASTQYYDEKECLYKQEAVMKVLKKEVKGNAVYIQVEELPMNEDFESSDDPIILDMNGSMCIHSDDTKEG